MDWERLNPSAAADVQEAREEEETTYYSCATLYALGDDRDLTAVTAIPVSLEVSNGPYSSSPAVARPLLQMAREEEAPGFHNYGYAYNPAYCS
ncbi:unnamed protein product [Caretta caretta]